MIVSTSQRTKQHLAVAAYRHLARKRHLASQVSAQPATTNIAWNTARVDSRYGINNKQSNYGSSRNQSNYGSSRNTTVSHLPSLSTTRRLGGMSDNQSTASSYCRLLPVNNILVDVTVSVTVVTCITRNLMLAIIPIFSYSSSKVREVRGVACLRQNHLFAPYTLTNYNLLRVSTLCIPS